MKRLAVLFVAAFLIGCPTGDPEPDPTPAPLEPGVFQSGAARVRMPMPLGIGTAGSNPIGGEASSDSPYAKNFPATTRLHGHPDIRAIAYSRGEGFEVILVRSDMIAMLAQLRDEVVAELLVRTGRDYDDALVFGATHTHSGPGRFVQGFYSVITDSFFPAFYEALVASAADVIEQALADLAPAEMAVVQATAPEAHDDRRCEDGLDYTNDTTPLIVTRKDGVVESVAVLYAMHGTILGPDDLTLTQDGSGAIESFVEQAIDSPAVVMMVNTWGADMSPGTPDVDPPADASALPDGYDKMERLGAYMSGIVGPAIGTAQYTTEPDIRAGTYRYTLGRSELGYGFGEFEYLFGAVYCSGGNDCETITTDEDLDSSCLPFPENAPAPMQSQVTVGMLAGTHFVTWAGECGTMLAEQTMEAVQAVDGVNDVLFFGYANDYLGYAIQESDWWYGGYEASGGMWGPKQGEHMSTRSVQAFQHFFEGTELPYTQAEGVPFFDTSEGEPVPVETALEVGAIVSQPDAPVAASSVVMVTVYGSDAWLGAPLATLQKDDGGTWTDVLSGGSPVTSDGYGFWVDMAPDPPFQEADVLPMTRHFAWTFNLPVTSRYMTLETGAAYRLSISVPQQTGDPVTVLTGAFERQ
jgi:hypothetical protein